ncbi:efflux RND transporter permease subunit [Actinopolymorpha sp. B9G3]|uniref:efflux RND transporter permease subunit n=1 Tax=Actinopolymorpha sp. B9G3 TaxID=3158970 RepID=UPI0032D90703
MSRLARLSLANRSLIALISIAILGFGVISTTSLKQELIPSLEIPGAFIATTYPGASPEIVEREVTKPIETAIAGTDGLDKTTSTSNNGFSMVQAEFTYGTDIDAAVQDVQQSINRLSSQLPDDVDPAVQAGGFDDFPVVMLAVSSSEGVQVLADRLEERVLPDLENIPEVRDVEVTGVREEQVAITLDDEKLADAGVSVQGVLSALQANGLSVPGGEMGTGDRSLTIDVGAPFTSVEDLSDVPIVPTGAGSGTGSGAGSGAGSGDGEGAAGAPGGTGQGAGAAPGAGASAQSGAAAQAAPPAAPEPVTLADVADVEEELAETSSITRTNGRATLGISVTKVADGNTVTVSHAVQDKLDDLRDQLGDDAELTVVFDQAPFIEESVEGLTTEGAAGLFFAVLVILVFLLSLRSTLVTAVSIPFSVLVAMIGLYTGGYSLNIFTLGALTVAVGRVVDDSIVVLENIKRHLAYGERKQQAIMNGVREVAGAVTASTLTTVGVFLPIAFVGGQVGELFRPFGMTVTIALLASLLVSLTIIPVLAYWFLRRPVVRPGDEERVRAEAVAKERRNPLQRVYVPIISWTTRHRITTVIAGIAIFAGTIAATPLLKTNFLDDSGDNTMTVTQVMPVSTSLARTDEAAEKVEDVLADIDGIESYQATIGSAEFAGFSAGGGTNEATFWLATDGSFDQAALGDEIRHKLARVEGAGTITLQEQQSGGFGATDIEVIVTAPNSAVLESAAAQVQRAVQEVAGTTDATNNLGVDVPTVQVDVDRAEAAALGLSDAQVGQAVRQAFEGQRAGTVLLDSTSHDVLLYTGAEPETLRELRALRVQTPMGSSVRLDDVATVSEVDRPAQLTRIDGERSATVSATPTGSDVGKVTTDLRAALDKLDLPAGASYRLGGVSADQGEAFAQLGIALLAAIAIVFMVMVATFRSIVQPLILLVSVPFAATGALGALLLTDTALGVPALIGLLMLVGIVVTNAIVLIDLINQYRNPRPAPEGGEPQPGMSVRDAVIEGGRRRLRPILMTALATICALVPMSLGLTGGGVFISRPLALVVIGGLISSTLLTLVLVPTLYTMVEGYKERRALRREARRRRARARAGDSDEVPASTTQTGRAGSGSAGSGPGGSGPGEPGRGSPDGPDTKAPGQPLPAGVAAHRAATARPAQDAGNGIHPSDAPPSGWPLGTQERSPIGTAPPTGSPQPAGTTRPTATAQLPLGGPADGAAPASATSSVATPLGVVQVEVFVRAVRDEDTTDPSPTTAPTSSDER